MNDNEIRELVSKAILELTELPERIKKIELGILDKTRNVETFEKSLKLAEATLLSKIATEKAEDGKPKFKNEEARQAELTRRLSIRSDYIEDKRRLSEEKYALLKQKIEANYLTNMFKAYRSIARMVEMIGE